jgi:hypothetical protein
MADGKATTPHYFHAEAHALTGHLNLPFKEQIKKQAFVKLEGQLEGLSDAEKAQRGYFSQHAKNFRLEGIISYAAAHTQVSGHQSSKHPGASVTLATSVVEDLNVLNVVTADRVVAQVSTTHFPERYTPEVTFLGTHFENLRIARHKAEPFLKLDMCSQKLAGDQTRVGHDTSFMAAVKAQYTRLKTKLSGLSADEKEKMGWHKADHSLLKTYHGGEINSSAADEASAAARTKDSSWDGIVCSLVEHVDIKDISVKNADGNSVQIPPPGTSVGHVIHIPDFGTVFLAELRVNHNSYNLTMIRLELGCLAEGTVGMVAANVNGKGKPPGP